jgi:hypothetical protein
MDHAEAKERLELAAIEPGGLDRLAAADDLETVALVAHVGACAECSAELDALRRSTAVIGEVIRTTPPADLRERTIAYVHAAGRPRYRPPAVSEPRSVEGLRTWRPVAWAASVAAAILVAVVATGWIVSSRFDAQLAEANAAIGEQQHAIEGLAELSDWTLRLSADADAVRQRLLSPLGGAGTGTVLFSAETGEVVMVASGLTPPPSGREYRCWAELNGERQSIGKMFFAGDLAYWVGDVGGVALESDSVIGLSLVDEGSDDLSGEVTLQSET